MQQNVRYYEDEIDKFYKLFFNIGNFNVYRNAHKLYESINYYLYGMLIKTSIYLLRYTFFFRTIFFSITLYVPIQFVISSLLFCFTK